MPEIVASTVDAQLVMASALARRTPVRTPGVHISDVIADLIRCVPSLAKNLDIDEATRDAMFSTGLAWEDAVGHYLRNASGTPVIDQCQVTLDGIVLTPDFWQPIEEQGHECKWTWKSSRKDPRDDWRWMTQVAGYCWAYRVLSWSLWVCHCNGDYAPPSPTVIRYDLTFNLQELSDTWRMLTQHAKTMEGK